MGLEFAPAMKILVTVAVILVLFRALNEKTQNKLQFKVPRRKKKPIVITKVGLAEPIEVIDLSATKYMVRYAHPQNYCPTYYRNDTFDELVRVPNAYEIFGTRRDVYMEFDVMNEMQNKHDNVYLKKYLHKLLHMTEEKLRGGNITEDTVKDFQKTVQEIVTELSKESTSAKQVKDELEREKESSGRWKSATHVVEATIEGKVQRRTEPVIAVATARARKRERGDGSGGDTDSYNS
jgi:hypothetical protein